jgi:hypothetical protein
MITRYRNRAIRGIALGLLMFGLVASLIALRKCGMPEVIVLLGAILLGIYGVILYLRGCIALAEAKGHTGLAGIMLISAFLPGAIFLLPLVLILMLEDRNRYPSPGARPRRKGHSHRYGSNLERIIRCRRNALLGICFGLGGIALGVCLVIFYCGIFLQHANEVVLGIFVFLCGYCAVLAGCWWWLKAKEWNEAIVFIGLMPLAILCIPFVRLILLAAPAILPVGMVMMPLILIVVVWVLPDKSEASIPRPWWERNRAGWHRLQDGNSDTGASRPNQAD